MPKYHAMSISTKKGLLFFITRTYLSVSLVALGISFKIMLLNLDDEVLPVKYANVFAFPFAVSLMLSDFAALLHDNGTAGVIDYCHIIASNLDKPIGRSLALLWLGKFAIYGVAFAMPSFALDAMVWQLRHHLGHFSRIFHFSAHTVDKSTRLMLRSTFRPC